jgi:hypothetical protein
MPAGQDEVATPLQLLVASGLELLFEFSVKYMTLAPIYSVRISPRRRPNLPDSEICHEAVCSKAARAEVLNNSSPPVSKF